MNYFNMPADFSADTLKVYKELNDFYKSSSKIYETYGQITVGNSYGSGRANDLLPAVDDNLLANYVDASHRLGIEFNYTFNTTCMSNSEFTDDGMSQLYDFLKKINNMGITSITVAMPSLIEFIQTLDFDFRVKASTLCMVNTPNKASAYEKLGASIIVLDESINRNFDTLKSIVERISVDIELITNVVCHQDCIYELFHHNQKSHDYKACQENKSVDYYSHRCIMKRMEEPDNLLKLAWIRPEDLKYYNAIGIHYFKLQGRQAVIKGDPVRTVKAYIEQKYDGDFMKLLDMFSPTNAFEVELDNRELDDYLKPFYQNGDFCKRNCGKCNYCHNYMMKHFNVKEMEERFELAKMFYQQYDSFINKSGEIKKEKEKQQIQLLDFEI